MRLADDKSEVKIGVGRGLILSGVRRAGEGRGLAGLRPELKGVKLANFGPETALRLALLGWCASTPILSNPLF